MVFICLAKVLAYSNICIDFEKYTIDIKKLDPKQMKIALQNTAEYVLNTLGNRTAAHNYNAKLG